MQTILDFLFKKEVYLPVLYIVLGIVLYFIGKSIMVRVFTIKLKHHDNQNRAKTIQLLLQNIMKYIIGAFVILAILTVYGIDVKAILAGLGIAGLVLCLALQDTIKDFLSGMTIILENQYMIGDTIEVNGFKGEVIFLGLKTTRIKHYEGEVMIISNRNITQVINYSAEPSLAIVDVSISYESDIALVEKTLATLAKKLTKELPKIKGEVQSLGINEMGDSALVYRMVVPAEPMQHYEVEREMRKQIKLALDQEHIKIPYPQIEVYHGK